MRRKNKLNKEFLIKDIRGYVFKAFLRTSPMYWASGYREEVVQEVEIITFMLSGMEGKVIDRFFAQAISNFVQRRAYRFWKDNGWRKVKKNGIAVWSAPAHIDPEPPRKD